MSQILLDAYNLADKVNDSAEVEEYLQLQQAVANDPEAQQLIREFGRVKELFTEAQRFGIFHPNYHEAKEQAHTFEQKLRNHKLIGAYMAAEERLDQLLYEISSKIASSVSSSIKIPTNDLKPNKNKRNQCHV